MEIYFLLLMANENLIFLFLFLFFSHGLVLQFDVYPT